MSKQDISVIPRTRRVIYATYANFPASGITAGDLAFATDRLVLYRWSGAAWQTISIASSSGATGAKPAAADLPNGSLYFDTTLNTLDQVQAGAWVNISSSYADDDFFAVNDGTEKSHLHLLPDYKINAAADDAYIYFCIPTGSTPSEVVLEFIGIATGTYRINIQSMYSAVGEGYNTHTENLIDLDLVCVVNVRREVDITGCLSAIAAGDRVGIHITGDAVNVPDLTIIGVRVRC